MIVLCALSAQAQAEHEQAFSIALGWATFSTPGKKTGTMEPPAITPDFGLSASLIYERSVSTDFSLRGELAGGPFWGGGPSGGTSYAALGDLGVVFRFDVLKYVPYAFGGLGGLFTGGGSLDGKSEPVLAIGGGVDWLTSRERSWGLEGRLASFGGDVTVFTLSLRGTIRWGYF
jgi:hypothetical protein